MKKIMTLCLTAALLWATSSMAWGYTFDSDNEGFTTCNIDEQNTSYPHREWLPSSWNLNGYVYATTGASMNDRPYFIGQMNNSNCLGDLTGKTLQANFLKEGDDFKVIRPGAAAVAVWSIADSSETGGSWYISNQSFAINSLTEWTTQQIELTASNFSSWPWAANSKSFDELLQSYSFVGITILSTEFWNNTGGYDAWLNVGGINRLADMGAYSSGTASVLNVDNLQAVPEPATLALLGLGGLLLRRRK